MIMNNLIQKNYRHKWIAWFTIITTLIIMAPTIFGFLSSTNEHFYTGFHVFAPADYPVYYSYIEQVRHGNYVLEDLFTGEDQSRVIINPFWLIVGLAAKILHIKTVVIFHLARVVLIPVFIITLYWFIRQFITNKTHQKLLLVFSIFSSGIGLWIASLLDLEIPRIGEYRSPPDMWMAEANTFSTLMHSPHFIASSALLLLSISLWIKSIRSNGKKYEILTGITLLFWFSFHPFHIVTIIALMSAYCLLLLITKHKDACRAIRSAIVAISISLPSIIYYLLIINLDWLTALRAYQNVTYTSPIWIMLSGYGFLVPLSIIGWVYLWKESNKNPQNHWYKFFIVWMPLHWILIYLPINFQRRLTQGLHVIMAITAWYGLIWIYERITQKKTINGISMKILGSLLTVLLLAFSTFGNWLTEFDIIAKRVKGLFLSTEQRNAFMWVRKNVGEDDIILTSPFYTGTILPGFTGKKVYAGHGIETAYFHCCKKHMVQWFYAEKANDEAKKKFLQSQNISYIWFDISTSSTRDDVYAYDEKINYLSLKYINNDIAIFKFTPRYE